MEIHTLHKMDFDTRINVMNINLVTETSINVFLESIHQGL